MKEILDRIENKNFKSLQKYLIEQQPADIAEYMKELSDKNSLLVFRLLPKDLATEVFSFMDVYYQTRFSELIKIDELREIVDDLYFDDKIAFLEELPANLVKKILQNTHEQERRLINQFLNYPEFSAGSLMTIEFVDLKKQMTVATAIKHIRETGYDKETIYTCYVIDKFRKLEGVISLRDILVADEDEKISELMETEFISIHTKEDQEEVAEIFKKYDFLALPVVDSENRLVGIITVDDIVDVIEEENTEDFHKMAALQPTEEEYLDSSILSLARKRIPWLLILMISATFTGAIMDGYEALLQQIVALMVFVPMLMGTGGNAGSQSSTLVVRGMALGEITPSDIFKVVWKEIRVSLIVGSTLALLNFLRIYYIEKYPFNISLTVSLTLIITVILAKVIGSTLPIGAKALKMDPAVMASPLITTILDALVLITYFTVAGSILHL
ncbi:magnesium transporter [Irregularibacter muris]|uniref:Magnesium transporter MgtE n=1 Tax=Irregularibacter muris TaxID=1796619 RepID=A0AAE3HH14_9FIRM|nr:magnesium transporter [Irregularibacter muris]MCR1899996.1 magnesium transporter [Irregularibacter muris]